MRELFRVWGNTRMIVLTAICAAAYVATLVPFKGFAIVPGLTEVRPGAAVPVALSFLFGPAAAWGAGFGNLIGDAIGGTLSPGSIPGFIGNFLYGYLPYTLWRALMGHADPLRSGAKGKSAYVVILVVDCLAIGSVIGWGVDALRLFPFAALGTIIAINNLIASAALSTILIGLLYNRVQSWGLLYFQIMDDTPEAMPSGAAGDFSESLEQLPVAPSRNRVAMIGATMCIFGAVIAFSCGTFISVVALHSGFGAAAFASQTAGSSSLTLGMAPGLALLLIGAALL